MTRHRLLILFVVAWSQCCFAQHWQSIGAGVKSFTSTSFIFNDTIDDHLYVGGQFRIVDNDPVRGIASWNGSDWASLGDGIDSFPAGGSYPGITWAMVRFGNHMYAGGNFRWAGEVGAKFLARWDGTTWDTIPGGQPNNVVDDVIVYNNELYISGVFDSVGNVPASGIARWDGTTWHSVGAYPFASGGWILKMAFYHGNLYVGGMFDDPSGFPCRLAKWDGATWQFMPYDLVGGIGDVWDFAVFNDELYVSGLFFEGAGNAGNSIMRWNDTTWRDVGGGAGFYVNSNPQVRQMLVHNGKLFCAGNFEIMGGVPAFGLASWDGTNWCGYNTSFTMGSQEIGAYNLEFYHDTLYVSGNFRIVEGDSMNGVAKWIGGSYVDSCGHLTTGIVDHNTSAVQMSIFPNPSGNLITITTSLPYSAAATIEIFDATGKRIDQIPFQSASTISINCAGYAEGIYLLRLISDGECIATEKLLISR